MRNRFGLVLPSVNEVAWGGTQADPKDEWIELVSICSVAVDLTGWTLIAVDGSPSLALAGSIDPNGFYLIERTDDTTVADIPADLISTFGSGLHNDGEQLELRDGQGLLIDTVNAGGTVWPNSAGLSPPYPSMERMTPESPDVASSWVSNDVTWRNGTDAAGHPVLGTPRSANAAYHLSHSRRADLVVAISGPNAVNPGNSFAYTLSLRNTGGITATDTHLSATLPTSVNFIAQNSNYSYTQSNQEIVWNMGDLPSSASEQITLSVELSPAATMPFTAVLQATSTTTELNTCDNVAGWTIQPFEPADLAITLRGPALITRTDTFSYHIIIANQGMVDLSGVRLTNALPSSIRYVDQSSSFPFIYTPLTLTWEIGAFAAQMTHTFTISAQIIVPLSTIELVTHTAAVLGVTPEGQSLHADAILTTHIGSPRVVIAGLLYDGHQLNDADEAISLANVGTATQLMNGWELCKATTDDPTCVDLPTLSLHPGDRVWLTHDTQAFCATFGHEPDFELAEWRRFANEGDAILLRAPGNAYIDTLVYKSGNSEVPGWSGATLRPYLNNIAPEEGQILSRRLDEATGLPTFDTDTASDWMQDTTDPVLGRRVSYPGWDMDVLFQPLKVTEAATLIASVAPDNAFEAISSTLMRAKSTISIEVYSLQHLELARLLAAKAQAGVKVAVLLEGGPVGVGVTSPEWQTQLYACQQIEHAGGACWFMAPNATNRIYSRYPYIHAKLLIVDTEWVAIGSQNLTPSGLPAGNKSNGTAGTRGVMLITDAPSVAQRAAQIFALDLDPMHHSDLIRWNTTDPDRYGEPLPDMVEIIPSDGLSYTIKYACPLSITGTFSFELVTAPEASLRHSDSLLGLLQHAGTGDRVYVEQLYEYAAWGIDAEADPNLRLQAYIDAARRGAHVRILLNGHSFIEGVATPPEENILTTKLVNTIAAQEHLDLRATFGVPTGDAIHNKMVLVHLTSPEASYVHIGSLNGSEVASKLNREIALQVQSHQLYAYLEQLFISDFSASNPIYLPMLARDHKLSPPVKHLLVSEVAYATWDTAAEWIELYNPTNEVIDLREYKIGDAESPTAWEPMFQFPVGMNLLPGGILVIAVNADQVPEADIELYESDPAVPNMEPYGQWGSTSAPFWLRDLGDQILLLNGDNQVVDVVVWGDRTFPETTPHPGVVVSGASLERMPVRNDTDDCSIDFRECYPPTPGSIPD